MYYPERQQFLHRSSERICVLEARTGLLLLGASVYERQRKRGLRLGAWHLYHRGTALDEHFTVTIPLLIHAADGAGMRLCPGVIAGVYGVVLVAVARTAGFPPAAAHGAPTPHSVPLLAVRQCHRVVASDGTFVGASQRGQQH